ncbi:NfeD family protein [Moorella sulfitireducens]|uniref:NfeD family protein n=1 Tax=Neomoorella sulfitireducens TaxID=2972948 RepID=UPI0021ABAD9B|nr:nodulation protein NfeD [Moorella sulfitireducens]
MAILFKKRLMIIFFLAFCLTLMVEFPAGASATGQEVYWLRVEGAIVPVVADYVGEGIRAAEEAGASCVLLEINTPGGLYGTTQEIVECIMNSRVPVIVYVSPAGAWAGSAGTFITFSAHVAAMAPGSRIGAAHPVSVGGEGEMTDVQKEKITQDAAAWVRSIAQMRGRDPSQAEMAVLESKSFSDGEALKANLIDLVAASREQLFKQLHGRTVTLIDGKEVELQLDGAPLKPLVMSPVQRLLFKISEPNIAYILLTVGGLGLIMELYQPGAIFPGVAGGISLLLGLYALGSLDAQFGGVLLILLGLGLLAAEAFVVSHGLLAGGGMVSFILGSLMLFSGGPPALRVSISLVAVTAASMAAFIAFLLGAVIKAQRRRAVTGQESLVGTTGKALTDIKPEGIILAEGERWKAESPEPIEAGQKVVIIEVEGLKVKVKKEL